SGGLKGLQWQATFLVPRSRRKQWDATLKKFAARWDQSRRIECTGPWPPYSFVGDERESGRWWWVRGKGINFVQAMAIEETQRSGLRASDDDGEVSLLDILDHV